MKRNGGEEKEGNTYRETDRSLRSWCAGGTARTLISRHTGISFQTYGPLTRYTDRSRNSRWSYKSFVTWPSFRAFATVLSCDMFNFCVEKKKKTCIILLLLQQSSSLPQAFFFFFFTWITAFPFVPLLSFQLYIVLRGYPALSLRSFVTRRTSESRDARGTWFTFQKFDRRRCIVTFFTRNTIYSGITVAPWPPRRTELALTTNENYPGQRYSSRISVKYIFTRVFYIGTI